MDITTTDPVSGRKWDLLDEAQQKRALRMVDEDKPYLIVLCPPCTMFSTLQNLNVARGSHQWNKEYEKAEKMLEFAMKVALKQHRAGRYFLFEHPVHASSWSERCERSVADGRRW